MKTETFSRGHMRTSELLHFFFLPTIWASISFRSNSAMNALLLLVMKDVAG